jgi:hypothetical protein
MFPLNRGNPSKTCLFKFFFVHSPGCEAVPFLGVEVLMIYNQIR